MNTHLLFSLLLLVAGFALVIWLALPRGHKFIRVWRALQAAHAILPFPRRLQIACNSILPEWMGNHTRSFTGNSSLTARWMLVKHGASNGTVVACAAASDKPIGVCIDMYNAADTTAPLTVILFGAHKGLIPVAISGSLVEGAAVYSDGAGGVKGAPTSAGTYWRVGLAGTGETTTGQFIALAASVPVLVTVIALPTLTAAATTGATNSSPYGFTTGAQADAVRAAANFALTALSALVAATANASEIQYLQS